MKDYKNFNKASNIFKEFKRKTLDTNAFDHEKLISIFAYIIPFIGWMIPLYFFSKNQSNQFHGKQGFMINVIFIVLYAFWWVFQNFIPVTHDFVADWCLIGIKVIFIALLIWGLLTVFWVIPFPFIKEKAKKLLL